MNVYCMSKVPCGGIGEQCVGKGMNDLIMTVGL